MCRNVCPTLTHLELADALVLCCTSNALAVPHRIELAVAFVALFLCTVPLPRGLLLHHADLTHALGPHLDLLLEGGDRLLHFVDDTGALHVVALSDACCLACGFDGVTLLGQFLLHRQVVHKQAGPEVKTVQHDGVQASKALELCEADPAVVVGVALLEEIPQCRTGEVDAQVPEPSLELLDLNHTVAVLVELREDHPHLLVERCVGVEARAADKSPGAVRRHRHNAVHAAAGHPGVRDRCGRRHSGEGGSRHHPARVVGVRRMRHVAVVRGRGLHRRRDLFLGLAVPRVLNLEGVDLAPLPHLRIADEVNPFLHNVIEHLQLRDVEAVRGHTVGATEVAFRREYLFDGAHDFRYWRALCERQLEVGLGSENIGSDENRK
eukprot:PhM_4_TR2957/c0_g1_i1/m.50476